MKLPAFYSSYFHVKNFFGDDGFQNIFVYQPTLNRLELLVGNQKVYLKLLPLHVAFLPNIKNFGIKIGIQFNCTPLVLLTWNTDYGIAIDGKDEWNFGNESAKTCNFWC